MNLLDQLVEKNIIERKAIEAIEEEVTSSGNSLEKVLEGRGISPSKILEAKGEIFQLPIRDVGKEKVPFDVLQYVAEDSARHYSFVPLGVVDGVLEIGIVNPDNIEALDALNFISSKAGLPYKTFLITESGFSEVLNMYKGISGEVSEAVDQYTFAEQAEQDEKIKKKEGGKKKEEEEVIKEDAPVTKIVSTILRYASEGNASDIHIEPLSKNFRVRFRVDGVLNTSLVLPIKVHRAVVARIKVLSNMKLDEKRKPQDGRFSATVGGRRVDFRVSTFPTYFGEKVVMRILDTEKGVWGIDSMGLSKRNIGLLRKALDRPFGIILISGPTGSGKSTTLYSMLSEVDRDKKNVLSLEDPVEYNIEGISQSQMMPEINYTFATGLRSTLRQDPDIIMVGEIRDKETAQLAIQAALTGHLVLSTIHTNNSAGVIPRLIDMGVDPFLIAPTLVIAIAQRLLRTLCPDSGKPVPIRGAMKAMIDKQFADLPEEFKKDLKIGENLYEIEPTSDCPNGTRGRTAVMEVLEMNEELEHVILTNPVDEEIHKVARKMGMLTMKEDAIIKSSQGIVPFEEVNTLGGDLLVDEEVEQIDQEMDKKEIEDKIDVSLEQISSDINK
jgi:type IV pilus assembly protein PilB